jgi:thymidylate synthase
MRFVADTLDDLCRKLFPKLLTGALAIDPTRKPARERCGVVLELREPLARLSRTETRGRLFSSLGELLWYLSRDNKLDFIRYYIPKYAHESEDGHTIRGGYGPRIFNQRGQNQLQNVVDTLQAKRDSRRAVIQLFDAEDISRRFKEIPCTCTLQFVIRKGKLHLLTTMRSNDAYIGFPHDVFCFTMLQEIVARSLEIEMGHYYHFVGSLHLYDCDRDGAQRYLSEAVQATVPMPRMPDGDPWPSISRVLAAEDQLRNGRAVEAHLREMRPYWVDLIRLLEIYHASGNSVEIDRIRKEISFSVYKSYIDPRSNMSRPTYTPPPESPQLQLPF